MSELRSWLNGESETSRMFQHQVMRCIAARFKACVSCYALAAGVVFGSSIHIH
ncbi:hypothetical protein JD969_17230 [Planctomycetota bacterium]|nr:hypothetical protein JD969_17230 [Planctomycetota bacterium]